LEREAQLKPHTLIGGLFMQRQFRNREAEQLVTIGDIRGSPDALQAAFGKGWIVFSISRAEESRA
jgi:hypothetical protein